MRTRKINRVARASRVGGSALAPTLALLSAVVMPGGTNLRLTFNVGVDAGDGAGGSAGVGLFIHATGGDFSGALGDISTTSGDTTDETVLNFDGNIRAIAPGEVLTLDYTQQAPGASIVNHTTQVQLGAISGFSVTNNA